MKKYLLGIDIGTSGVKAGLFDEEGQLVSISRQGYAFSHPGPGLSELDPNLVWDLLQKAVRACMQASGCASDAVAGIGLSVLGETAMPVDEHGDPLHPAIESMDQRANAYQDYIEWFETTFGSEAIFKTTSYPLNLLPPPHKMLWFKDHRPEIFKKIAKYVSFQDFTIWKLTGKPVMDYSIASRTMLFDIRKKTWVSAYFDAMGVPETFMSPTMVSTQVAGVLSESAAAALDLVSGIPVVPGAHDQSCAAVGVGVIREGVAVDGTGSVEAIATATRTPIDQIEQLRRGHGSQCHISNDLYLALGFHLSAGSLVQWYRNTLGRFEMHLADQQNADPYNLITSAAADSPPGSNGLLVLPHWSGSGTGRVPALNPHSKGAVLGLRLAHTKADLDRAIFEGITFETRFIVESLEASGIPIDALVVTGGGAKSDFWLQLKADITGKRIIVPDVTEASLLGAALLAGVGAGVYADLTTAVEKATRTRAVFEPDAAAKKTYDWLFPTYQKTYDALIGLAEALSDFNAQEA